MGLVLQPVQAGTDARGREIGVLELDRPRDPRDVTNLGLMLPGAKQLLTWVQQAVVAVQARNHAALRLGCSRCGTRCHVKDWRSRQHAALFGTVEGWLPRYATQVAITAKQEPTGRRTAAPPRRWINCRRTCPR